MINLRLTCFLESNNLLSNLQTGFRAKRSTIDKIVHIETLIREAFIKKEHLVAVAFDQEKAYDTTWLYGILKDIKDLDLQSIHTIFIKHILEDRTFQTPINNTLSDPKQQDKGVLQGRILLMILLMKRNKIATCLSTTEINRSLYVYDLLICYSSKNMDTIERKMVTLH